MKKKILSLLLGAAMCASLLIGCQQSVNEPQLDSSTVSATEPSETDFDSAVTADAQTSEPTDTEATTSTPASGTTEKTDEETAGAANGTNATTATLGASAQNSTSTTNKPETAAQSPSVTTTKTVTTTTQTPAATTTTTTAATTPTTTYPTVNPGTSSSSSSHKKAIADITAMNLFNKMTVGWNLGNSLDSVGSGLSSETAWGNPKVTKSLIDAVKAAGFDTIRIPVTWMGHFDNNTLQIDQAWLKRVDEVINYALSNDMYVIINMHHDGMDSSPSWLTPAPSDEAAMINKFKTLWYQISEYFKEYDEHLLFAGMNEFHAGYGNPTSKYLQITDKLNQAFVDTVRATGGNNSKRILIVQSYNTSGEQALKMTIPTDTVSNKLMVEFHFYDPWDFAGEGTGDWGKTGKNTSGWGQEDWVDSLFSRLKTTFVNKNIPVIIGEYGAVNNKNGNDDYRRYYVEYVTKAAKENGLLPIWWDNGNDSNSGEAFALFNRSTNQKLHQDIHDAIMRAVSGRNYTIALP